MSPNHETSFWARVGLQEEEREVCIRAIERVYERSRIEEFGDQGCCSFTMLVTPPSPHLPSIIQLRPPQHGLDLKVVADAQMTYGSLAPAIRVLEVELPGELRAIEMNLLPGVPFSRVKSQKIILDSCTWTKQVRLVKSFASFIARAWRPSVGTATIPRHKRADSLVSDGPAWLAPCTGTVGLVILSKLQKLARELPDEGLRRRAQETLLRLLKIDDYPTVLNHGDLIPTNVLVHEENWEVSGLVDWAEAEDLPFGVCLYGLEHLLGFMSVSSFSVLSSSSISLKPMPVFQYYNGAEKLRDNFWEALVRELPELKNRVEEVQLMRDIGVFLWSGYAWDEGRIDRVVNETDDAEEVACLRAFLGVSGM
jgi:hypothetical protein